MSICHQANRIKASILARRNDSRSMRAPLRVAARMLAACLLGVSLIGSAGEYQFKLEKSFDSAVCQAMDRTYNTYFRDPFNQEMRDKQSTESRIPVESRYPTSPEFDAVMWQIARPQNFLADKNGRFVVLVARVDIDNDGTPDIVVKDLLFDLTPSGFERLVVFAPKEFDLTPIPGKRDLVVGQATGAKPRIIDPGAAIVRPFVLHGTTYLSDYNFSRERSKANRRTFLPPEVMRVQKYLGGGRQGDSAPARFSEICEFHMKRMK